MKPIVMEMDLLMRQEDCVKYDWFALCRRDKDEFYRVMKKRSGNPLDDLDSDDD